MRFKHGYFAAILLLVVQQFLAFPVFGQDTARTVRPTAGNGLFFNSPPTAADYLQKIGFVYELLNRVSAQSPLGYDAELVGKALEANDSTLHLVRESLSRHSSTLNIRNLQMFRILLNDVQGSLKQSQAVAEKYSQKLAGLQRDMGDLRNDTLLLQLVKDTASSKAYLSQLRGLRDNWMVADSATRASLAVVNNLETHASRAAIIAAELHKQVDERLGKTSIQAFGKELNYLWESAPNDTLSDEVRDAFRQSWRSEEKALQYYYDKNAGALWLMFLSGLLFFGWVSQNFRQLKKAGQATAGHDFKFQYLNVWPVAASVVFMLSLAPLFDIHPPAAHVESIQFLLMLSLTFLFWRRWPRSMLAYWGVAVSLFLLFSVTRFFIVPGFGQRAWILALNSISVVFGVLFLLRARKFLELPGFVRRVVGLFIFLNLLSVLGNLFGRFTLARIFGSAAIFGFVQIIALATVVQIVVEAVVLQIKRGRVGNGLSARFEHEEIEGKVRRLVTFVALTLWFMVFAVNLNIYDSLYSTLLNLLTTPRSVGSATFTFGGIVTFFAIIAVANLLQRYLGYFLGDTDDEFSEGKKGKRSRLLIVRLILLASGFLLAVAASGLPIDKITIVLGALGVGIGLGLQNIVNNLVSGVILIFERPMQIGDTIQVGTRKGRVKGIGIRSSKLLTPEGAEVIVPNGDLLSQHIVNYTLSNNHIRIDLPLKIDAAADLAGARSLIIDSLLTYPQVLKKHAPIVLINQISGGFELNARFWCADINKADELMSELGLALRERLQEQGFKML